MHCSQHDRVVSLSTNVLEALLSARLIGVQLRIILWVIRHTAGWNRTLTPFSWYRIAKKIGGNRAVVWRAGRTLFQNHVLLLGDGQLGIQHEKHQWRGPHASTPAAAPPQTFRAAGDAVAGKQRTSVAHTKYP